MSIFIVAVWASVTPILSLPTVETPKEVFRKALSQRQSLSSGMIEVSFKYQNKPNRAVHWKCRSWFKDEKLRTDSFHESMTRSSCHDCLGKHHVGYKSVKADSALAPNQIPEYLMLTEASRSSRHESSTLCPDPRYLGLVANAFLISPYTKIDPYMTADEDGYFFVEEQDLGRDQVVVGWRNLYSVTTKFWIDKSKNYAVRKVEHFRTEDRIETIESDLEFHETAGIWYPKATTYTEKKDGETICSEELKVTVNSIGEPIMDDSVFSIKAMDFVKKGTSVFWRITSKTSPGSELIWDGKEIVDRRAANKSHGWKDNNSPQELQPAKAAQYFYINAGIICMMVGAYFFVNARTGDR